MLFCLDFVMLSCANGKGLSSWLSFVISNCVAVTCTFSLVSWVRCGA